MDPRLIVVARNEQALCEYLKRQFERDDQVQIILDRRWGERRRWIQVHEPERRRTDRRHEPGREDDLRTHGFAIIRRKREAADLAEIERLLAELHNRTAAKPPTDGSLDIHQKPCVQADTRPRRRQGPSNGNGFGELVEPAKHTAPTGGFEQDKEEWRKLVNKLGIEGLRLPENGVLCTQWRQFLDQLRDSSLPLGSDGNGLPKDPWFEKVQRVEPKTPEGRKQPSHDDLVGSVAVVATAFNIHDTPRSSSGTPTPERFEQAAREWQELPKKLGLGNPRLPLPSSGGMKFRDDGSRLFGGGQGPERSGDMVTRAHRSAGGNHMMPALPLEQPAGPKTVIRYADGRVLHGYTHSFHPEKPEFPVFPVVGGSLRKAIAVKIKDLKAVFFVREFGGDPSYNERKCFADGERPPGRKVAVKFIDGEVLIGSTVAYHPKKQGFILIPADPTSNNLKVHVVLASVTDVRFL